MTEPRNLASEAATKTLTLLRDLTKEGYTLDDDQRHILYEVVSAALDQAMGDGEGPERAWEALISALYGEMRSLKATALVDAEQMAKLARLTSFVRRVMDNERTDGLYDQIKREIWG